MYKKYRETKALNKEKPQSQDKSVHIHKKDTKPDWNFDLSDPDKYKLSQAEMVQKKFSYISKHRNEAKEHWLSVQDKLQKGVKDAETEKIMETALLAKNLLGKKKNIAKKKRKKPNFEE